MKWFWGIWVIFMLFAFLVMPIIRGPLPTPPPVEPYESSARLGGLPLFAYGVQPRGIIAVGDRPTGVVAVGGVAVGAIAVGGVALGGIAFSGLSIGILALGGGAVGYYAAGALAVGGYAYAGNGVALGYYEARGRQKEKLLG